MKIQNKDFWEKENIIETQDFMKTISGFEKFMIENAKTRYKNFGEIENIKIFGCGTGREVVGIAQFLNLKRIVASDISSNMIAKCQLYVKNSGIEKITQTVVGNAVDFDKVTSEFELVTIFNSMLTYVSERKDRLKIFKNCKQMLKENATIIGTVHNQEGAFAKTYYFKMRKLFSFILGEKVGNRDTGFKSFSVSGYYYDKISLVKDLTETGFKNIEVYSLEEFYASQNEVYDRNKGYNNLIFVATK